MSAFREGLAEILEVDPAIIGPEFSLQDRGWDSLAIISCVVLIDDVHGVLVGGADLARCATVSDLEALAARAARA